MNEKTRDLVKCFTELHKQNRSIKENKIKDILRYTITAQQYSSVKNYISDRDQCESMISIDDFKTWYNHYCYENNLFNDLKIERV